MYVPPMCVTSPPRVTLTPTLKLGHAYNLSCFVPNVSPVRNLSVSLRRGNLTLHTATFWGHSQEKLEDVLVTHKATAQLEDHGQSITCQAVLDLQPYGPLFNNSTAQVLEVYGEVSPLSPCCPSSLTVVTPPLSPCCPHVLPVVTPHCHHSHCHHSLTVAPPLSPCCHHSLTVVTPSMSPHYPHGLTVFTPPPIATLLSSCSTCSVPPLPSPPLSP
uniref:Ig-like domain-containing protein n=1 Tax=Pavo cristatus TaxID=9049 RepID=A0A8C9FWQ8_PAVCR